MSKRSKQRADAHKQIRTKACERCAGTGMTRSYSLDDMGGDLCPRCGGSGRLPVVAKEKTP